MARDDEVSLSRYLENPENRAAIRRRMRPPTLAEDQAALAAIRRERAAQRALGLRGPERDVLDISAPPTPAPPAVAGPTPITLRPPSVEVPAVPRVQPTGAATPRREEVLPTTPRRVQVPETRRATPRREEEEVLPTTPQRVQRPSRPEVQGPPRSVEEIAPPVETAALLPAGRLSGVRALAPGEYRVDRIHCPCCGMMVNLNRLDEAPYEVDMWVQVFGGPVKPGTVRQLSTTGRVIDRSHNRRGSIAYLPAGTERDAAALQARIVAVARRIIAEAEAGTLMRY